MAIDWSKVGESALLIAPTALVSAYVGARIKAHLDRAKPAVSVSSCRTGTGRDLLGTRVDIPPDVTAKLRASPWCPSLSESVNTSKVDTTIFALEKSVNRARSVLAFLDERISELPKLATAPDATKRHFLDTISDPEVGIIFSAFIGALVRHELVLPLPPEEKLAEMPRVIEYIEREKDTGGYSLDIHTSWVHLFYRDKLDNPQLLPAAKAFSVFCIPAIQVLLDHSRNDILRWAAGGDELIASLQDILDTRQHLVVDVTVVNRGRSAVLFSPWALLRIVEGDRESAPTICLVRKDPVWQPADPLLAIAQQKALEEIDSKVDEKQTGFVVEGTSSKSVTYQSEYPLKDLKLEFPKLVDILSMEVFYCQVALKRGDIAKSKGSWVSSGKGRFGKAGECFPKDEIGLVWYRWNERLPWRRDQ